MQINSNGMLTDKLQGIADIEASLKSQKNLYAASLKADREFAELKEIRLKIKYLEEVLKSAGGGANSSFAH